MKSAAVLLIALTAAGLGKASLGLDAETYSAFRDRYEYSVPAHAKWELIGEWEYPGRTPDKIGHFTTSIVKVGGKFVDIQGANIPGDCCAWPRGILLVQGLDGTFFNPISGALYAITSGGSLRVVKGSGSIKVVARTASNDSMLKAGQDMEWR